MATNAQIQSILDYFGSNSSIYRKIVFGTATDAEISYAFTQIPQMKADISAAGTVLGYKYADPVYIVPSQTDDIVSSVNSNNGFSTLGGSTTSGGTVAGGGGGSNTNYNVSFGRDPVTGQAYIEAGKDSLGQTIKAVADRVSLGMTGVNIGCKLGKAIDQTLYNLDPNWWDTHFPTINPDTWPSLVGENELGQKFFRTLFNIQDDGTTTAYVDERVIAQTYQMLRDLGVWDSGHSTDQSTVNRDYLQYPDSDYTVYTGNKLTGLTVTTQGSQWTFEFGISSGNAKVVAWSGGNPNGGATIYFISDEQGATAYYKENNTIYDTRTLNRTFSRGGRTFYYNESSYGIRDSAQSTLYDFDRSYSTSTQRTYQDALVIALLGQTGGGEVEGITDIVGGPVYPPNSITGNTLPQVLEQLKQNFPDLFRNPITNTVLQPDGTTQTINYVPIPWQTQQPVDVTQTAPVTQENPTTDPETDTEINPDIAPEIITHPQTETQPFDDTTTPPPTTTTPDTGEGNTDPIVLPTGQASSLWAIYNPTQAQLDSFGGWLWSSNFVEQLKKLFNDPMQAIIGVHKVFATPSTGGSRTIVCGYLDSGVSSKIVTSQYSKVDCGSISLSEYFGNVFDYSPFTTVKIFLPFIGIVPLDVAYIMRSTISVEYTVDVLTGACLANVSVTRDGCGGVLFTYGGSAIVSYPISSGSYTGVVAGALSLATGIVGTVASGGAMLPATLGALSGLGRMKTEVQHSGQFSGSAGAMGGKKPYLIISRPQTRVAGSVENYEGKPSNATIRIGDCVGFTRITQAHLMIPNAYNEEINEIENLLKMGVII